ncbi:MAG: S8 family serine peptidase [Nitrospinota bacterium]|nr:S8 family serine peptidase [Nitrospinota bacterium]
MTWMALLSGISLFVVGAAYSQPAPDGDWYISHLNIPHNRTPATGKKEIVIAIVDDGVRTTHRDLKDFIWTNPKEIPRNHTDDDGNGYIDDIHGWDVSDHNNIITPPPDRLEKYYHGTHLAGIVTRIARTYFGDLASRFIKIMPVKSLADEADKTYLKEGYKGIHYAIQAGADIILCAWSVPHISRDEIEILEEAHRKGIVIVASAGNFPEDRKQYPAAHPTVIAVAASNPKDEMSEKTNYGQFVDLSAPGMNIQGASSLSDTGYELKDGTSFSTAMVAAAAALVLSEHPSYSDRQVEACLKSSAKALEVDNPLHTGKLGAGLLNIEGAVKCEILTGDMKAKNHLTRPQGYLRLHSPEGKSIAWTIQPQGQFKGIRFRPVALQGDAGKSILKFYADESADAKFIESYPLANPPESIFIPGTQAVVVLQTDTADPNIDGLVEYEVETIDFRNLYCRGTRKLNKEGIIEDGSGPENYSMETSCKWLITAPRGKVIHFKFSEFDTEALTDWVYFFNGSKTNEKIMAGFSGPDIPPELTTWRNQVLVWFVTDSKNQGKGWKAEYRFVDPKRK